MIKRKVLVVTALILLTVTLAEGKDLTPVYGQEPVVGVTLDGKLLAFEQPAVNFNGNVLVPMRTIFESLGAVVQWNNDTRCAIGKLEGKKVEIPIGSNTVYINGKSVVINQPAEIINEKTLVPIRVVSEGLGATVNWDQKTTTVIINSEVKSQEKPEVAVPPETEKLEKQGVQYAPFTHYSQFGWGLAKEKESQLCVVTCWAMLINNLGIPANPVDVYVANDKSAYLVWSKVNKAFGVVNSVTQKVYDAEITEKAGSSDSEQYKELAVTMIKEKLEEYPQGVMVTFNKGIGYQTHSMVAIKAEGDTIYFDDPAAGGSIEFEDSYVYKRGQGWGNLYAIQVIKKK
ncbi:MAG: copper amine oxidase N-terminal domain-containing protein [Anaerovorax sp.]